ncbi:MAG: glucose 1-dehydrogenase [Deltaproteobacteria bacterium]|nr:glucose 1-dehydrogenase [Deltaproteobacteria bacterium]
MKKLQDKVAIITGAGSGIGAASAYLFAREGAKVVVADLNQDTGREVMRKITEAGGTAVFIQTDVSISNDVERMIQTAVDSFGRVDILFNNAGILGSPLENLTETQWRKELDIMLTGPFLGCHYAIPIMKKQGGGNIINTGSVASFIAGGSSPGYTAAKGGLLMLTKYLGKALAKDQIRVNCICPGAVDTGITVALWGQPSTDEEKKAIEQIRFSRIPMGRAGSTEEVAAVALFLASDESSYITGAAIPVDGGMLA